MDNSFIVGNNTTGFGGGIAVRNGSLVLQDSTVGDNSTSDILASGGGIAVVNGNVSINRSNIVDNTANFTGGGLAVNNGIATITGSTVSGNFGGSSGGGISVSQASLDLINSTVSENSTGNNGGGIDAGAEPVRVINSTIVRNTAVAVGGVLVFSAPLTIENSIIAENTTNSGTSSDVIRVRTDAPLTINNSLIGNADGLGTINGNVGNLFGTEANPLDPMLGDLADNGGPTLTHALLPGSPAINGGDNARAIDADGNPLTFDQRGEAFDRVFADTVDMGAFELIDLAAPTVESIVINNGDAQRSMVNEITVSFSEIVNVSAADFLLQNTDTGTNVTPTVSTQVIDGKTVATLTFSGTGTTAGSLDDGNYSLTILDSITDALGNQLDGDGDGSAGGNATDDFFRLFGDSNGDGTVNIIDFFQFRNTFGDPDNFDPRFDVNGDGVINILDFFQFRSRFGTSI